MNWPDAITCPRCGMTSWNPTDVRVGYCGNCHAYHDDMPSAAPCTGIAAGWCPVHGSCTCPKNTEGYRVIDHLLDSGCALHGGASNHAAAITQECNQPVPDAEVSSPEDKAPTGGLTSWDF